MENVKIENFEKITAAESRAHSRMMDQDVLVELAREGLEKFGPGEFLLRNGQNGFVSGGPGKYRRPDRETKCTHVRALIEGVRVLKIKILSAERKTMAGRGKIFPVVKNDEDAARRFRALTAGLTTGGWAQ